MQYNYNKLKQKHILDVIEKHYKTRELDILKGEVEARKHTNILLIGGDAHIMFTIEDGVLHYFSGLKGSTAHEVQKLSRVMDVLQSCITLECVELEVPNVN